MRLEASLLRSEQEKDGLTEALFHARADAHKKTGHLRTTVQVRAKLTYCIVHLYTM